MALAAPELLGAEPEFVLLLVLVFGVRVAGDLPLSLGRSGAFVVVSLATSEHRSQ